MESKKRYEILRQDPDKNPRLWYIWDNEKNEQVCESDGAPVRFDTLEDAQAYVAEVFNTEQATLTVELYKEDGKQKVYISEDCSSGSDYTIDSLDKVGTAVQQYVESIREELE